MAGKALCPESGWEPDPLQPEESQHTWQGRQGVLSRTWWPGAWGPADTESLCLVGTTLRGPVTFHQWPAAWYGMGWGPLHSPGLGTGRVDAVSSTARLDPLRGRRCSLDLRHPGESHQPRMATGKLNLFYFLPFTFEQPQGTLGYHVGPSMQCRW